LPKLALGAAAALAAISLSSGDAQAITYQVTVNSIRYNVTTFTGRQNLNPEKFNSISMPWFTGTTNSSLASQFAIASGAQSSGANGTDIGPYFTYRIAANATFSRAYSASSGDVNAQKSIGLTYTYAILADPVPAPGPLPLFGAAAAFGFSRQLRRRIQVARKPLATSQPRA
jgi:hypothetical protein